MDMVKADISHSRAFHRYVNACSEDGLDIYTGISDSSDAYLKGESLIQKVRNCQKVGRLLLRIFVSTLVKSLVS